MAEFTLINRQKNLIFLQTPCPCPFEVSALELQTLQAGMANPANSCSTSAMFWPRKVPRSQTGAKFK
jgi:hypothetical protein